MPRQLSFQKGLLSVLFWSIIAAAFIGPGTVTTASNAGASFGYDLLWALTFSIIATIILQEAAARVTIASSKTLGEIISLKYPADGRVQLILFLVVAFGCMAYQAGNLVGAISGLELISDLNPKWLLLAIAGIAGIFLWIGNFRTIANLLGLVVALMGIAFIYVALNSDISAAELAPKLIIPSLPEGSGLLVIGLIGTTIVPYNLFLASGISQGQQLKEMRLGITLAVIIGGLISMAILIVGTLTPLPFSFAGLAETLTQQLGPWGGYLFGFGLFVAGLTSSITAPLAAAVTAQSLLGSKEAKWQPKGRYFRYTWGAVLLVGLLFSLLDFKPVQVIILAQAINGLLLPVVAIFLLLAVNDRHLLGANYTNKPIANILAFLIVGWATFLGMHNLLRAVAKVFPDFDPQSGMAQGIKVGIAVILLIWLALKIRKSYSR